MFDQIEPHRPTPSEIVEALWHAWKLRNKREVLSLASDDIVYELNVPQHVLLFGGASVGKRAFSDRLQSMIEQIEVHHYRGAIISVRGNVVRGQVSYRCRHRLTGHESIGTMRQIIKVENGLITSIQAFKDAAAIQALMTMVSHSASQ